ncbi:probable membrane-associated kinase regulator 6 [Momordica charantia]|uniref:Probable membrane-associated kinase regulator 6 n=1 Tax=Momordica charantia TaxID=3673 RepID=A0A6J1D1W2_MOMCH|nr:probable membrane-associated kinase regulator 6 [Momordica charantia]XP_022147282.1 probable membrane-associated kinase regulator 6 [Momordica charantia]
MDHVVLSPKNIYNCFLHRCYVHELQTTMDDSRPLAVESFSASWLSNVKQSYDATSKMMDYKIVKPSRFLDETQNFKFNTPIHPSVLIAHADELFFDGSIRPVYISHATLEASDTSDFVPVLHNSSLASLNLSPAIQNRSCHSGRWRRSLCMLQKYLGCLSPICHKGHPGDITWVDDIKHKSRDVKSRHHSPRVSPQRNSSSSSGDWCHLESSIYEAILHCKKSIGE